LSLIDRLAAWLLTGPVGRVVAFLGDLGAALGGWALRRLGLRRDAQ
jgi:hypothetical protein